MAFTVDYSKASQYYNVQDGEYETVITGAGWDKTFSGTEYVKIKLRVRDDINQAEKGETIEHPLWKSKPENAKPSDIDGIPAWRIQQVSKAAQLPEGESISTLDDWFRAITNKPMRVTVKQDDQGRAKVQRVEESMYPVVAEGFVPVDDDEPLPF